MAKFLQGKFIPKNPEKYVGNKNDVRYRQQWELKFMSWADQNPGVLKWNSEELVIPYISPVDGLQHRYFVDFMIMVKTRQGEIKKYAVEIKPESQTVPPKQGRNKMRYLNESATYAINQAKWESASKFCNKMGMEFVVLTEKHLKV